MTRRRKEEEEELVLGQRFPKFDERPEVTYKDFNYQTPKRQTTGRESFNSKFIKTEKGTLARRGTVGARRAENREKNRKRAQQMAKDRKAKKQQSKKK